MVKNTKAYDSMYKSIDRFIRYSPDSARAIDEYFIECDYLAEIADDGIKIVMKTYDWSLNRYLTTIYDDIILSIVNKDENDKNDYKKYNNTTEAFTKMPKKSRSVQLIVSEDEGSPYLALMFSLPKINMELKELVKEQF